jgi:predicted MFS family arabinose efflux permease
VLLALLLALVVGVLIEGPRIGWTSPAALSAYGTIVLVVVGLCRVETRRDEPLIDPGLFRLPSLTGSVVSAVVVFVAFSATLLLTTILLQTGLGWTAGAAGAATLPMAVGAIAGAPLSGYLLARIGPRVPLLVAGGAILVGGVLLVTLAARMSLPALLMAFAAIGIGVGVSSPPITNTAVSSLPSARAGVAGGLTSSARQVGTAIGVALAGGLAAGGAVGPAVGPGSLLLGWVLVASCGAATMALALLAPHSARGPARQTVTGTEPSRETA